MSNLRSVTIRLDRDLFDKISRLSSQSGKTLSNTIRALLEAGLAAQVDSDQSDSLAKVVREQMSVMMEQYTSQLNDFIDEAGKAITPQQQKQEPPREYRVSAFFRTDRDNNIQ